VAFVQAGFPEVRAVSLEENKGFCGGNNEGIRKSRGEWIKLLNNDTEVVPDYLAAIDRAITLFPDAGMFACKMFFFDSRGVIDNCGFSVSRAGTAQEIGRHEIDRGEHDTGLQPFGPSGGAAVYSRKLLEKVGLLDEDFFLIYSDVDLAMRARVHGSRCYFVPEAVVYHKYRSTLADIPDWQVYYAQRNIEFTYLKNMPVGLILQSGLVHLLYDLGGLLYFARKGLLRPFLRAKFQVIRRAPELWRRRGAIQSSRVLTTSEFGNLLAGTWLWYRVRKFLGSMGLPARQEYGA